MTTGKTANFRFDDEDTEVVDSFAKLYQLLTASSSQDTDLVNWSIAFHKVEFSFILLPLLHFFPFVLCVRWFVLSLSFWILNLYLITVYLASSLFSPLLFNRLPYVDLIGYSCIILF